MDALHKALAGDTNSIIAVAMTSIVVLVTFIWLRRRRAGGSVSAPDADGNAWHAVGPADDYAPGTMREVDLKPKGAAGPPKKVLLVHSKSEGFHAMGAKCSHYGAPLKDGVLSGCRVTCPWHAACFDAKTGDIEDGCAIDAVPSYPTRVEAGVVQIHAPAGARLGKPKRQPAMAEADADADPDDAIVILGAGPAGLAAAQTLREEGFTGPITMISEESELPYDRVKLSKVLGADPKPLRGEEWFEQHNILHRHPVVAVEVNTAERTVYVEHVENTSSQTFRYSKLLCATGGFARTFSEEQKRFHRGFSIPGAELEGVFPVRVPDDTAGIEEALAPGMGPEEDVDANSTRVVIMGSSFIGMEVAAYLATTRRVADITVLGMENEPFERVLGPDIGHCMRRLHEQYGNIKFRMPVRVSAFEDDGTGRVCGVTFDGETIPADLVVVGAGIIPSTGYLDEAEGVQLNPRGGGVIVDEHLRACEDVYAAGDIAAFPYWAADGEITRVEHWDVAIQQGRIAARNMLGKGEPFRTVPFFWTQQYGAKIRVRYAGHAREWDEQIFQYGKPTDDSWVCYFVHDDAVTAVATLNKDPWAVAAAELLRLDRMPHPSDLRGTNIDLVAYLRDVSE